MFNCGHMTCESCGSEERMDVCPTCRVPITSRKPCYPTWRN
ncbi:MAG: hypothetical protein GY820_14495 [Gammaproteobacteria bacterium]|nr:hypothetical protein [Gammaproteobacteria bacterium]